MGNGFKFRQSRPIRNLIVSTAAFWIFMSSSGRAALVGGTWGCTDYEINAVAACIAGGVCDFGDTADAVFAAAYLDETCPDGIIVGNFVSASGATGGQQVAVTGTATNLSFGRIVANVTAVSTRCSDDQGGYTGSWVSPDGCNPPPPPGPQLCTDPNDPCFGQLDCCKDDRGDEGCSYCSQMAWEDPACNRDWSSPYCPEY